MKRYFYFLPHLITLAGLAFAALALMAVFHGRYDEAARYSLLVLLADRLDGTLARKFQVRKIYPSISGETLDTITDLVGLTFVPMFLFWQTNTFIDGLGGILVIAATVTASWKYSRKENFLKCGYSAGAPPIFFTIFLFYFLQAPPVFATVYAVFLIGLCLSPIKYPITSLVTTHWKFGYKSITNYLTAIFFVPVIIMLQDAPAVIYWIMLIQIGAQLIIYPFLLSLGIIKPVFDRKF
jgi:phosphatidylcholine synthase